MLNDDPPAARRYQDQVPAVARAVRVLELLAVSREPRPLADLARELELGASSLLAILTTLRHAGLVVRDDGGRYRLGPGLVALGSAAACKVRACERFAAVADRLVEQLGETVLLWVLHEETFVLAAAREGTQPLRCVPTPGWRLPASRTGLTALFSADESPPSATGLTVEEELLPGVWTVAAAVATGSRERACIALAGPRERLGAPSVRAALLAACQGLDGVESQPSVEQNRRLLPASSPATTSGPFEGAELDAFLSQGLVATLSYLAEDGYPATVPLWYAWDGASFWLASRPGSEWAEHVRLDPRVSLAISESTPPLRRVLARGLLTEMDDPGGTHLVAVEAQLAERYAGFDAAREPATAGRGRLLELKPERLIAWRGLLRHPKLPPDPEDPARAGATAWRNLG
ncbi:MAG: helix-turn-helix domain-containing protein [Chloroflexota bacterium]